MSTANHKPDETVEDVRRAWRGGRAIGVEMCVAEPSSYLDEGLLGAPRNRWSMRVDALLDTGLKDLVGNDHVMAVLGSDRLGSFMEEIERLGRVVLAIEGGFQLDEFGMPGSAHEITLVRLSLSEEDPFDWIEDDNFIGCEFGHDWLMLQVALSALGLCRQCFWATDTDEPAAWSIQILWPEPIDPETHVEQTTSPTARGSRVAR